MDIKTCKTNTLKPVLNITISKALLQRTGPDSFSDFLRAKGILKDDEIVKGISFFRTGNLFDVEAYIMEQTGELRRENVQITLEDFFNTFKRFSIKLSRNGEFDDQEIEFKE
ncbi:hypothetical protein [Klebsiella pneumoniae]|uniref:hypothetical protein n=1 Tax=Klebsiella pneumoniae TaxID=573 RepID=UPI003CEF5FB7